MNPLIWKHRSGLPGTRKRLEEGSLTLGFLGGSITDARPKHNWPEPVIAWFVENFPNARISVENAGIGATGSEQAVFRAQRDIVGRDCDLVFVEYAVNDNDTPADKRAQTREGLLRKLLAGKGRELVLTYTYSQPMYEPMSRGEVPHSVADFEKLGEHYGIGSVWMGLHAFEEVKRGRMRWEEWLPDALHPTSRGSLSYAQAVIQFLEKELLSSPNSNGIKTGNDLPTPLHPKNWERSIQLDFSEVKLSGPWTIRRYPHLVWIDQILYTAAVGAKLSFSYEGRGLSLGFDFGKDAAEFRYRFDGGGWKVMVRDRPIWCPPAEGWYRSSFIGEELEYGKHTFELEVTHGNAEGCTGTNFRLGMIGVVR